MICHGIGIPDQDLELDSFAIAIESQFSDVFNRETINCLSVLFVKFFADKTTEFGRYKFHSSFEFVSNQDPEFLKKEFISVLLKVFAKQHYTCSKESYFSHEAFRSLKKLIDSKIDVQEKLSISGSLPWFFDSLHLF